MSLAIQILWWERAQVLQTGEGASEDFLWAGNGPQEQPGSGVGDARARGLMDQLDRGCIIVFFLRVRLKNRRQRAMLTDWQKQQLIGKGHRDLRDSAVNTRTDQVCMVQTA